MKKRKLTARQERFVEEYLIDLNATQAAVRAGYSAKTAHSCGPRLLANAGVAAAISAAKQERVEAIQSVTIHDLQASTLQDVDVFVQNLTDEDYLLLPLDVQRELARLQALPLPAETAE